MAARTRGFPFLVLLFSFLVLRVSMICTLAFRHGSATTPWHFNSRIRISKRTLSMVSDGMRTLGQGSHEAEMDVKKSRFIGYAKHVETWSEAKQYIDDIKALHPKARHWCYAVRCGYDPVTERCSDDGEPTGTAGIPILGAIKGEELSDAVCVVVRYFGGIKLGAGGLIRAYGGAARLVLREAPVEVLIPKSSILVTVEAVHIGTVYDLATKTDATVTNEEYDAEGRLTVTLTCETSVLSALRESLNDLTRGDAVIHEQ